MNTTEARPEPAAWLAEGPGWKRVFLFKDAAEKMCADFGQVYPLYASPVHAAPVPVAVKGLEWKDAGHGGFGAMTAFGWAHVDDNAFWSACVADGKASSIPAAKAAAQADYEARIRSALAPATQAGDMVGALREAQIDAIYDAVRPYVREFVDFQIVRYVITKAIAASGGGR
ncbi:hypothetical protein [Mesorhizobium sp.]|uniref:hypothetical protein n=1 Tax=Mesorhizobium sp. TaxID=1871066 RepID=UPI000FEA4000|nr:hypothetical protein [Mesorhizobium sp.]RWO22849.1 MAG: hypothetical protein EOS09_19470 [Mesorhizobium sp.]